MPTGTLLQDRREVRRLRVVVQTRRVRVWVVQVVCAGWYVLLITRPWAGLLEQAVIVNATAVRTAPSTASARLTR
jgi:hypothetical protein